MTWRGSADAYLTSQVALGAHFALLTSPFGLIDWPHLPKPKWSTTGAAWICARLELDVGWGGFLLGGKSTKGTTRTTLNKKKHAGSWAGMRTFWNGYILDWTQ